MASLLNNASLLFNPAGSIISYQEDKIYSVLPKDGTGDFTFSGGDGGTRVNQQGYVEVTPANLINQSEAIGSSPWILNDTSLTANSTAAPNGTTTADTIANNGNNAAHRVYQGPFTGYGSPQTMSFSLYVKYNNHQYFSFGLTDDSVYRSQVVVDLVNGTITQNFVNTGGDTLTSTITNVGGGWYYVTGTFTYATSLIGGNAYFLCMLLNQSTFTSAGYVGTGTSVFVWGAMFNTGGVKPYQPTTDRLNYPRITYQNGRGALLGEPQRTNLCTYSEDLTNGVWSKTNVSITSNDTISPDGTQNADRVTRNGTSSTYFNNTNTLSSSNRVNSMFFKKGTIDQVTLLGNSYSSGTYATFNLSNGTIINSAGCTPFVEQYRDGWYRCGFVQTNGVNYYLLVTLNGYNNDTVTSGEYLYAWGGQTELGEFVTSYIPTTSATVTRPADVSYVNGISSIIGQTQGVLYAQVTPSQLVDGSYICISDNSIPNRLIFGFESGTQALRWYTPYGNGSGGSVVVGQQCKIAAAYNVNDLSIYLNGIQVANATSGQLSGTYSHLGLDSYTATSQTFRGTVNNVALFNTRLTNTQLAELTTVRSGSGGTISYYGPYTIHTFTGSTTFTPSFNGEVEVLVVAGGGGGGYDNGGGGGAGGLLYASSYGVAQGTGITVTIGAGGVGGPNGSTKGTNGGNSVFGGLTALGGGGGGSDVNRVGLNGGSGGGTARAEGGSASGLGTPGQGNNGGSAPTSPSTVNGGGGGGAGQVGETSTVANRGGNGGNGLVYSINGFSTYYAGGGGGGSASGESRTNGGLGGGGFGSTGNVYNPTGGTDYLGGGGGGGPGSTSPRDGKNGGIGIVIVRYLT